MSGLRPFPKATLMQHCLSISVSLEFTRYLPGAGQGDERFDYPPHRPKTQRPTLVAGGVRRRSSLRPAPRLWQRSRPRGHVPVSPCQLSDVLDHRTPMQHAVRRELSDAEARPYDERAPCPPAAPDSEHAAG